MNSCFLAEILWRNGKTDWNCNEARSNPWGSTPQTQRIFTVEALLFAARPWYHPSSNVNTFALSFSCFNCLIFEFLYFPQILIDGKDPNAIDIDGCRLPTLVYLAREKRPQHHHNFKAGSMNALVSFMHPYHCLWEITGIQIFVNMQRKFFFLAFRMSSIAWKIISLLGFFWSNICR